MSVRFLTSTQIQRRRLHRSPNRLQVAVAIDDDQPDMPLVAPSGRPPPQRQVGSEPEARSRLRSLERNQRSAPEERLRGRDSSQVSPDRIRAAAHEPRAHGNGGTQDIARGVIRRALFRPREPVSIRCR